MEIREKIIATLKNELECVLTKCDRDCAKCPLVMKDEDIEEALQYAIRVIEGGCVS